MPSTMSQASIPPPAAASLQLIASEVCYLNFYQPCVRGLTFCAVQYGIVNGTTSAAGNELGIFEDLNDHYSTADLDAFLAAVYP